MATYVPAKKNTAYTFYVALPSQANTKIAHVNPTLADGDVLVAVDDAAPANMATLPVVDADFTKRVKVVLSASEMNGDNITIIFSDAAGAQWCDLIINIQTSARQIDDLAFPNTSGRGLDVDATGGTEITVNQAVNVAQWNGTTVATPATAGIPDINVKNMNNVAATAITAVNANQGTTQPINFTGTGASALAKSDMVDVAGAAVSTSAAQIGVNAVNIGGTAQSGVDIGADTNDIQARLPAALVSGRIDASVGAMAANTLTASALAADAATEIRSLASGTSDSGSTTTMVDAARTEADTDFWKGQLIVFTSGNVIGQARVITGFDAATDTITFAPATTQAIATQTYEIWPIGDFLRPTTSGRMLDVSTGGEAGLDWANIGSPTTAQNLSATNIDVDQIVASVTGNVGGNVVGSVASVTAGVTVTTNNDKTGYGLSAAAVQAIWDALTSALTTAGSIGKKLADWVIGTTQTGDSFARLGAPAGGSVSADIAAVKVDTAAILVDTGTDGVLLAAGESAEIADAVWDEALAGHLGAGSTGLALNSAGAAGDPWSTALPGAYGAGTAGKIVGDNVNATISSRLASAGYTTPPTVVQIRQEMDTNSVDLDAIQANQTTINNNVLTRLATAAYTAPDNADILLIKAKTDNLPAAPAAVSDIPTATQNADAYLKRDMAAVTGEAARSPLNAFRAIRNKSGMVGTTYTVTKEDDTTPAWTAVATTDAAALPIIGIDPT